MTDSDISVKQTSGDDAWRDFMQPALGVSMYHLLASINMKDAWKKVKANKGAPGIDGITVQEYPAWINEHWPRIQRGSGGKLQTVSCAQVYHSQA